MSLLDDEQGMNSVNGPAFETVVWCITDGKPGHESQLRGFVTAIERQRTINVQWLHATSQWKGYWDWASGRFPAGASLPNPDLIVAAGHATHSTALAVRRANGGRVVLLMRPSLPLRWFDLCLVPEHDLNPHSSTAERENVIPTCGVLNTVQPVITSDRDKGLLLIGGPSKHHDWDDESMADQVRNVVRSTSSIQWTLTTSRRTPTSFLSCVGNAMPDNLTIVPCEETAPGWVASRLIEAATVFVSEDSVSMVYEALSSTADVGLFHVPRRRSSRVIRGVDRLAETGLVIPFKQWTQDRFDHRHRLVLQEADRCAEIVCQRLLDAA